MRAKLLTNRGAQRWGSGSIAELDLSPESETFCFPCAPT